MSLFKAVAVLGAISGAMAQAQGQIPCTDAFRSKELNGVAPAFSDQTPGATAAFLQQLPLAPDATLTLYINGAPGIEVAPDAALVRDFALGVRQVFYYVYPTSDPPTTNYANGTSHTELEIELGALHDIALPVDIHAGMNFNYDTSNCLINSLQGFLTIPSEVDGQPVSVAQITDDLLAAGYAGSLS